MKILTLIILSICLTLATSKKVSDKAISIGAPVDEGGSGLIASAFAQAEGEEAAASSATAVDDPGIQTGPEGEDKGKTISESKSEGDEEDK